jgi:hypothetical protein
MDNGFGTDLDPAIWETHLRKLMVDYARTGEPPRSPP